MATRASRVKYFVDRNNGLIFQPVEGGSRFLYSNQRLDNLGEWSTTVYSARYRPGIDYPLCKRTVKFFEKHGYVKGFPFADPTEGTAETTDNTVMSKGNLSGTTTAVISK